MSTAFTGNAGTKKVSADVAQTTPCAPNFTIAFFTPLFSKASAAFFADSCPSTGKPTNCPASTSLGVMISTKGYSSFGKLDWAGAGSRITVTPAVFAVCAAATTVDRGISNCKRSAELSGNRRDILVTSS